MKAKNYLIRNKNIFFVFCVGLSFFWIGCSAMQKRQLAESVDAEQAQNSQTHEAIVQNKNLSEWFQFLRLEEQEIKNSNFNKQTCQNVLRSVLNQISDFNFNQYSVDDLKQNSQKGIEMTWSLRFALHSQLSEMNRSCRLLARDIFHELHDHADYYGEFAYPQIRPEKPEKKDFQNEPVPILNREAYAPYSVSPEVSSFEFKAGDLILARGTSFLSAIITQLTDNRSHFSHAVVVVEKKNNNKLEIGTVESYTTTNVDFFELTKALKNENARLLVLRPKNHMVAKNAAQFALQFANEKRKYDFDFNFDDYSKLSCVEVAKAAYDLGSDGAMQVPEHPAQLDLNNVSFLQRMNFKNGPMITPGDLEFDSHFEMILDWRDYRLTRNSRYKDIVMSEIVYLMNAEKYIFISSGVSKIASTVVLPSRTTIWWPIVSLITGVKDINPLTPASTVDTMAVMDQVATMMLNDLQKVDERYQQRFQRPMTNAQLRTAMKIIEKRDKSFYEQGKNSFHQFFRIEGSATN